MEAGEWEELLSWSREASKTSNLSCSLQKGEGVLLSVGCALELGFLGTPAMPSQADNVPP